MIRPHMELAILHSMSKMMASPFLLLTCCVEYRLLLKSHETGFLASCWYQLELLGSFIPVSQIFYSAYNESNLPVETAALDDDVVCGGATGFVTTTGYRCGRCTAHNQCGKNDKGQSMFCCPGMKLCLPSGGACYGPNARNSGDYPDNWVTCPETTTTKGITTTTAGISFVSCTAEQGLEVVISITSWASILAAMN